jgi:superfamily II DNA or RNA helicase
MSISGIDLSGGPRRGHEATSVPGVDAERQTETAAEILKRFASRPVQLLADEVGMGKTYVALAVAAALRPARSYARVAVLVPNEELVRKWEREVRHFMASCVRDAALCLREPRAGPRFAVGDLADLSGRAPARQLAIVRYGAHGLASKQFPKAEQRLHAAAWALSDDPALAQWRTRLKRLFAGDRWFPVELDTHLRDAVRRLQHETRPLLPKKMPTGKKQRWTAAHIEGQSGHDLWAEATQAVERARKSSNDEFADALRPALRPLALAALISDLPVFDLVIIDEAHNWVNRANGANAARLAFLHRARHALLLTATPLQLEAADLPNLLGQLTDLGAAVRPRPPGTLSSELGTVAVRLREGAVAAEQFRLAWAASPPDVAVKVAGEAVDIDDSRLLAAVENLNRANRRLEVNLRPWFIRHWRSRSHRRVLVGEEFVPANLGGSRPRIAEGTVLHEAAGTADDAVQLAQLALMRLVALASARPGGRTTLAASMTGCYSTVLESKEGRDFIRKDPQVQPYLALLKPHMAAEDRLVGGTRVRPSGLHPKLRATLQVVQQLWEQGDKVLIYCWRVRTAQVVAAALRQQLEGRATMGTWRPLERRLSEGGLQAATLDRLVHSLCLAGRVSVPYRELVAATRQALVAAVNQLTLGSSPRPRQVRQAHNVHQALLASVAVPHADGPTRALLEAWLETAPPVTLAGDDRRAEHPRLIESLTDDAGLLTGPVHPPDGAHPAQRLAMAIVHYTDKFTDPVDALARRRQLVVLLTDLARSRQTLARLGDIDATSASAADVAAALARPLHIGGGSRSAESFLDRLTHLVESLATIDDERNLDDAIADLGAKRNLVEEISGDTKAPQRTPIFEQFNSPLFPDVLVCTQIGGEGIDLQRFCRVVIHYDLSFNPAKLEQRTGRCDRIGSKAEREGADLIVGVPLLAGSYDERIYATLLQRDREQEALIGSGVGGEQGIAAIDLDLEDDPSEPVEVAVPPVPRDLVELLRCKYHVWSPPDSGAKS